MSRAGAIAAVAFLSLFCGLASGVMWRAGNSAAAVGTGRLVFVAIITNFIAVAIYYYLVRGGVSWVEEGGMVFLWVLILVSFVITVPVSATVAGSLGSGTAPNIGANAFTWGMSLGYGQAIHDVRAGRWLHED